uniref:Uncharacterized protein n=1 Tax=Sipha flava TaxID=143950 RepID=A0A2S2R328_9HEMI
MRTLQKMRHGSCCDRAQFFRTRAVLFLFFFHPSPIGISALFLVFFFLFHSLRTCEYIAHASLCRLFGRTGARARSQTYRNCLLACTETSELSTHHQYTYLGVIISSLYTFLSFLFFFFFLHWPIYYVIIAAAEKRMDGHGVNI